MLELVSFDKIVRLQVSFFILLHLFAYLFVLCIYMLWYMDRGQKTACENYFSLLLCPGI